MSRNDLTPDEIKREAERKVAHKLNMRARHLAAQRVLDALGPVIDRRSHLPTNQERRAAFDAQKKLVTSSDTT